ncbi:hypothetical protein AB0A69_33485 [Streptomyces sp. NPDC045431]|uniref:hypothetical protein n=1 Tax=Streptomyces sp. NPDC045431 TaxID=3155613 RepID=UPI00340397D1
MSKTAAVLFTVAGVSLSMAPPADAAPITRSFSVAVYNAGQARAHVDGIINWTGPQTYSIPHAFLRDTSCDGHTVHFRLVMNGKWKGPERENRDGCNTTKIFSRISASSEEQMFYIRYVEVQVCRNELRDTCAAKRYWNPHLSES